MGVNPPHCLNHTKVNVWDHEINTEQRYRFQPIIPPEGNFIKMMTVERDILSHTLMPNNREKFSIEINSMNFHVCKRMRGS